MLPQLLGRQGDQLGGPAEQLGQPAQAPEHARRAMARLNRCVREDDARAAAPALGGRRERPARPGADGSAEDLPGAAGERRLVAAGQRAGLAQPAPAIDAAARDAGQSPEAAARAVAQPVRAAELHLQGLQRPRIYSRDPLARHPLRPGDGCEVRTRKVWVPAVCMELAENGRFALVQTEPG